MPSSRTEHLVVVFLKLPENLLKKLMECTKERMVLTGKYECERHFFFNQRLIIFFFLFNLIPSWFTLSIQGKLHYKAKFFPLKALPQPSPDFLANLKEKPFDRSTLITLITLQQPNGSILPPD